MLGLIFAGELQQVERANHVGVDVGARILEAVAHTGLRGEMDDDVRTML